jgi:hypothetical protein
MISLFRDGAQMPYEMLHWWSWLLVEIFRDIDFEKFRIHEILGVQEADSMSTKTFEYLIYRRNSRNFSFDRSFDQTESFLAKECP